MTGFKICRNTGFHITFENGVTVSVQFGGGNYCDNYNLSIIGYPEVAAKCANAEIAIFEEEGEWLTKKWDKENGDVVGYVTPDQLMKALKWAQKYIPNK